MHPDRERLVALERDVSAMKARLERATVRVAGGAGYVPIRLAKTVKHYTGTYPTAGPTFPIMFQDGSFVEDFIGTPLYEDRGIEDDPDQQWVCNIAGSELIPEGTELPVFRWSDRWWTDFRAGGTATLPTEFVVATSPTTTWAFTTGTINRDLWMNIIRESGGWSVESNMLKVPVSGRYKLTCWASGYVVNDYGFLSVDHTITLSMMRSGSIFPFEAVEYRLHNPDDGSTHFGMGVLEWIETLTAGQLLFLRAGISTPVQIDLFATTIRMTARRIGD